jgi:hypothetical protein
MPLYIGSTTGKSQRFRTRMGDMIADLFGFFDPSSKGLGHSSGGRSLYAYCNQLGNPLDPMSLYVSWVTHCECAGVLKGL